MTSPAEYHEQTKHHFHRYAASAGYLDWDNQPVPFRWYTGSPIINLPLLDKPVDGDYEALFSRAPDGDDDIAAPSLTHVAALLELSMGLSAWKSYEDSKWALRMNPSSGNLHPTEAHLIVPSLDGHPAGVYHYNPYLHQLEQRRVLPSALASQLFALVPGSGFFLLLSSIHWREAWKYGERAFRYCQHDVGHAMGAITFAARLTGWLTQVVVEPDDVGLEKLVGFDKVRWPEMDHEAPDILLCIHNGGPAPDGRRGSQPSNDVPLTIPDALVTEIARLPVQGTPNPLSATHIDWGIEDVAASARRNNVPIPPSSFHSSPFLFHPSVRLTAEQVIRSRRSAQSFDPSGHMPAAAFYDILDRTVPRNGMAPFDIGAFPPLMSLFLYVHKVDDVIPGLYGLVRNVAQLAPLQQATSRKFLWQPAHTSLPLYRLHEANLQRDATVVSCQQDIAGDSCFSLGMIAQFSEIVHREPWRYRHLFWEAGMIGQVLYLGAQAHGFMGTGIGCYFDDGVHETLGMRTTAFQSMYHFTVGKPLLDTRLATLPPYAHLTKARADRTK